MKPTRDTTVGHGQDCFRTNYKKKDPTMRKKHSGGERKYRSLSKKR